MAVRKSAPKKAPAKKAGTSRATPLLNPEVDAYIAQFPAETAALLQQLRQIILSAVPGCEEVISYKMPAYKMKYVLVYFAGYAKHIGFYPTGEPIKVFAAEIASYKLSKGAIQFPLDKPLPAALVKKIVRFRANWVKAGGR